MMAVVFAFPEALGVDTGTERCALERTYRTLAQTHGWTIDEAVLASMLQRSAAGLVPPAGASFALSAAFAANTSPWPSDSEIDAVFRLAGKACVADHFMPFDDVAPALRDLAEMNVPMAFAGDGWGGIEQRRAESIGVKASLLLGEDLGFPVMSLAGLAGIARSLILPADRIWVVGSSADRHIRPASAAGFQTVWVNRDDTTYPAGVVPPSATIASFDELVGVLSEPYTRGLLLLRHIMRTALEWRPGHFLGPEDLVSDNDETN